MKALLYSFSLIVVNLYVFSAEEWLYYKHYPWVYDNATEDWLYLRGAGDGKVYAYKASTKEWAEFNKPEPTWDEKYEEWMKNPLPYGGQEILQQIKVAKNSGVTTLILEVITSPTYLRFLV